MAVKATYPHVEKRRGQPARLKNNPRVRVAQIVVDYQTHGWTAEEFRDHYPHLRPAEVHAALTYYYDHLEEIDDEIRAEVETLKQIESAGHLSPFFQRMKKKILAKKSRVRT